MLLGPTAPFPETALRPCFLSVSESVSPTRDISALGTIRLSVLAKAARGLLQLALVAFVSHRLATVGSGALLRPSPSLSPPTGAWGALSEPARFRWTFRLPNWCSAKFRCPFFTLLPFHTFSLSWGRSDRPSPQAGLQPRFPSVSDSASPLRHRLRTSRHWEKKTECTCYGATGSVQLVLVSFRETD